MDYEQRVSEHILKHVENNPSMREELSKQINKEISKKRREITYVRTARGINAIHKTINKLGSIQNKRLSNRAVIKQDKTTLDLKRLGF